MLGEAMRYYAITTDKDAFCDHICEKGRYSFLISFDADETQKIVGLFREQFFRENPRYPYGDNILSQLSINAADENGALYTVNLKSGEFGRSGSVSLRDFKKIFRRYDKALAVKAEKKNFIKTHYKRNTVEYGRSPLSGYGKGVFYDAESGLAVPFRLHGNKNGDKMPLLIYLHGAGASGEDNFKQLVEFKTAGIKFKRDCFVLLPQYGGYTGDSFKDIGLYTRAVRSLAENIAKDYPVDMNRIYVTGISFGGACTWYSVYNNPGFYAAAVPLMGYMPDAYSDTFDKNAFKGVSILAAHAKDDKVVPAESDINVCDRLKDLCNVKFSLYDRGGHRMMREFYRKENWQNIVFSAKRLND